MRKCSKAEVRRLKTVLRWKIPAAQRQRIQMVLLRESGMAQPAIAAAMGVSLSTVNRAHMAYAHGGINALKPKPNGGRKHENISLAEEKALLARFAKAAGAGEMLNIHDLKAAYEKAIGHGTSESTVYNLLHRHSWLKLMPRPFHPKRDLSAQSDFKKTAFLMLWGEPGGLLHGAGGGCGSCSLMRRVSAE
jgi:transposase